MTRFVVPIEGADGSPRLGGKGAGLVRFTKARFPVPRGFVVTTDAFRATLGGRTLGGARRLEDYRARVMAAPFAPELRSAITAAYADLAVTAGPRVAVRSSATLEDGHRGSMAGLAWTELNVAGVDDLLAAIRRVWASLFRPEVLLYEVVADRELPLEMAVVVQQLVPADVAGVMFTANPVTRCRDEVLISATYGLGQAVVEGDASDTYAVDRHTGAVRRSRIGHKAWRVRPAAAEGSGLERDRLTEAEALAPALSDAQLGQLCDLARRAEEWAGEPQDLEWALEGGKVWLLQARPVTGVTAWNGGASLIRAKPGASRSVLWSNANVGESLPGVATPLTWSIIRGYARQGFVAAFGGLGLSVPEEYRFVGAVRGRVYLNLTEFLSVTGQIPFLSASTLLNLGGVTAATGDNQGALTAAGSGGRAGIREASGDGFGDSLDEVEIDRLSSAMFILRLPLTAGRLLWSNLTTPGKAHDSMRRFRRRRDAILREDLAQLSKAALRSRLDEVTALLDERGGLLLEVSSNFLASYVACRGRLQRVAGGEQDLGALFSGVGGVASAEPGLRLLDLAHRVRQLPALGEAVLGAETLDALRQELDRSEEGRTVVRALDLFLARYGLRAAREAELSTPRWNEDPAFVLSVLKTHVAAAELPESRPLLSQRRRLREETTARLLSRVDPVSRRVLRLLLEHALRTARLREALRTEVIEVLGLYRRVFLAAGQRLVEDRITQEVDDIFSLTVAEVREYLEGTADVALGLRAALRCAQTQAFRDAQAPPDSFVVREGEPAPDAGPAVEGAGPVLSGIAASPGSKTGRVRVVTDPMRAALRQGEVLVARQADAGWTPLFLVAGAVVLETGGPLSHACVIAREYGVPVVTGLSRATRRLHEGDLVTVDGDRGLVHVLEYGAQAREPEAVPRLRSIPGRSA